MPIEVRLLMAPVLKPFYQPGGALPLDSPAYVQRGADDELFSYLIRGDYCSMLTSRQMGKSSLIARTSARLRAADVTTCVIDLSCMSDAVSEPEKWYFALVLKVGKALGRGPRELAELWSSSPWPSPAQRWTACVEHLLLQAETSNEAFHLVVFLDEIDATRDIDFKDGFFAMIRGGYNRRPTEPLFRRLTFCLVGSARPTDLIADPHLTPFNIGRRIELTDFSEEEAQALVPGMDRADAEGKALLRRVLYWTGGHPYLTHRLCMRIAESESIRGPADVDELAETLFFSAGSREQDDNLAFVGHRVLTSLPADRDVSRLLATYDELLRGKRVRDHKSDPVIGVLHVAGLVRTDEGILAVRNRIYLRVFDRVWVRENMPDAQLRMVRIAYWRAAVRWAGLAVAMAILASFALVQRQEAIRHEAIANSLAHKEHTLLMQSMQVFWDRADLAQMEATLRNTPESERNFEWRYWLRQINQNLMTLSDPQANGSRVAACVFAPDGSWLATSGKFPFIDVWDAKTGRLLTRLPEPMCPYTLSLDVSPDGRRLVSGGEAEVARIWDTQSWRPIHRLDMGTDHGMVTCVRFSPDGKFVAASTVNGLGTRVFDAASGKMRLGIKIDRAWAVAFGPYSALLAVAGDKNQVTLWPSEGNGQRPVAVLSPSGSAKPVENFAVDCLEFSSNGRLLATGSKDNSIRIWDVHKRQIVRILRDSENGVSSVAFMPSGSEIVAVGLDRTIRVWNYATGDQKEVIPAHSRWINCIAISRTGLVATASDDGSVKTWTLNGREHRSNLPSDLYAVSQSVNVDGQNRMPAFTTDGRMGWLDPGSRTWTPLAAAHLTSPYAIFGTSDGGRVIEVIDQSGEVIRWNGDRFGHLIDRRRLPDGLASGPQSIALSPDGDRALIGLKTGQVARVDLNTGKFEMVQSAPSSLLPGVAWSPGQRPIWSAGASGHRMLYISDERFAKPPISLPVESSGGLFLSNDGSQLLVACATDDRDPDPTLIDLNSLRQKRLVGHATACRSANFSPDGSRIVTSGADNTVRLWDAKDGFNLLTWRVNLSNPPYFSADGNQIVLCQGKEMLILSAATADEVASWTKGWPNPD